ncbi:MAG: FkbM family methyltransferase [Nitrospirae bacterium]|nr:FkbM family methyltransferase [Nitrospirota bacterium]
MIKTLKDYLVRGVRNSTANPEGKQPSHQNRAGLVTQKGKYLVRQIGENMVIATSTSVKKNPMLVRLDKADPFIFNEVFIEEIYSLDNARIGKRIEEIYQGLSAKHVPLILDLGANVGYTSVYYANRYPKSFIVSIECEKHNFDLLRKNTESFPNIMSVHAAIDSESERQVCVTDRDTESTTSCFRSCRFVIRPESGPSLSNETIGTYTVDKLISMARKLQPDIVPFICKIDIEGHEKQLFTQNTDWLEAFHVLIGEGHDHVFPGEKTAHEMLLSVVKYGFDIMAYSSNFLCVKYK